MRGADPQLYPRAAAYLASLPDGIQSYPQCKTKGGVIQSLVSNVAFRPLRGTFPDAAIDLLDTPPAATEWVNEVPHVAITLGIRDALFDDNESYFRFGKQMSIRLYRRPLYRLLMFVATPRMLFKGATERWAQLRQGTQYTARMIGERSAESVLSFPPHHYTPLRIQTFADAVGVAVEATGGRIVRNECEAGDSSARFITEWRQIGSFESQR